MTVYRHYGKPFNPELFKPVTNDPYPSWTKPMGGFWVSDVDSEYGWVDWCEENEPGWVNKEYFDYTLRNDTRILVIDNINILKHLPKFNKLDEEFSKFKFRDSVKLDFEVLSKKFDVITVEISKCYHLYNLLYGWDCDSTVILNPEVLVEYKKEEENNEK